MYVWEAKLLVRRRACEGRLADYRERFGRMVEWRSKYEPRSVAWNEYDKLVRVMRDKILRELDEIQFVKELVNAGPIVGGELHVPGDHGYRGPSILDLFDREAENDDYTEEFQAGITHARSILSTPYKFLSSEERAGYDKAEKVAEIANEERIAGAGSPRSGPPRRSRVTTSTPRPPVAAAVLVRIDPTTGKAERSGI